MKRKNNGEAWHGKISYENYEEEIKNPADVEKKIEEGTCQEVVKGLTLIKDPHVLLKTNVHNKKNNHCKNNIFSDALPLYWQRSMAMS